MFYRQENKLNEGTNPTIRIPARFRGVEIMIECLNSKQEREGYINKKRYLNPKKKLWGYLEGNRVKDEKGYTLLILQVDGTITYNEELQEEEKGQLKENKILDLSGGLIFEFLKEKQQIINAAGEPVLLFNGSIQEIEQLENIDFFGIVTIFLELFS